MSTIQEQYQQSLLAQAAYANFSAYPGRPIDALGAAGMTATQAATFLAQYRVVNQLSNTTSGFSAVAFEQLNADGTGSGKIALAPRGSELGVQSFIGVDITQADLTQILGAGLAYSQIVDMYNYKLSLQATAGQPYQAAQLQTDVAATQALQQLGASHFAADQATYQSYKSGLQGAGYLIGADNTVQTVAFVPSTQLTDPSLQLASGSLQGFSLSGINVAGHSLGFELAASFSRLFPDTGAIVTGFNGVGFVNSNPNVNNLFAALGGQSQFNSSDINNIRSSAGFDIISQNGPFIDQPGTVQDILTGPATPFNSLGHGIGLLSNTLGAYANAAAADPTYSPATDKTWVASLTDRLFAMDAVGAITPIGLMEKYNLGVRYPEFLIALDSIGRSSSGLFGSGFDPTPATGNLLNSSVIINTPNEYMVSYSTPSGHDEIIQNLTTGEKQLLSYDLGGNLTSQKFVSPPQSDGSLIIDSYKKDPTSGKQVLESSARLVPQADGSIRNTTYDTNQNATLIQDYQKLPDNQVRIQTTVPNGNWTTVDIQDVPSGKSLSQNIETVFNGSELNVSYSFDNNNQPYISSVNSINGVAPTDPVAAAQELAKLGVTQDMLTNGTDSALQQKISGVVSTFDATHPTGIQTVIQALPTVIDALAFIKAIQTGQALPVVASGLNLVNALTSTTATDAAGNIVSVTPSSYGLAGAAGVGNGILSILSLDAALKRGDTLGAVVAGAQTVSYGVSAYTNFATAQGIQVSSQVTDLSGTLNGTPGAPGVLSYLNLVNDIANGNTVGTALDVLAIAVPVVGVPLEAAYAIFDIISSLFGDTPSVPAPWGNGHYVWDGAGGVTLAVAGQTGGDQVVSGFMNNVLASLNTLIAQEQQQNPGSALGIIASRMPSLSYDASGFSFTDIDPLPFRAANDAVFEMRRRA